MAPIKLLTYPKDAIPAAGFEVLSKLAGPLSIGHKEPAGHLFHLFILKQHGLIEEPKEETTDANEQKDQDPISRSSSQTFDEQPPAGVDWKGSKKKKKSKKSKESDLYALLGLQHERWTANEQQIKNAYRKVCLESHPDKKMAGVTDDAEKEKIENAFKAIQEAYETLSDPAKRREYDSVDDFDDSLPLSCDPKDFFKVFAPAFKRNSRWSVDPKVPDVGDENTPWELTDKFYDFWFTFKSWREFPHPDEEDVEQAESREHKRWIDRINSKLREKGKKEEGRRLREFVEAAFKLDPRVARRKEQEREARERKKQEKEASKRRVIEEEERKKAEAEAVKKAAEEEAKRVAAEAKRAREDVKRATKKERQRLRQTCAAVDGVRLGDDDIVEKLCAKLDALELAELNQSMAADGLSREQQDMVLRDRLDALEIAEAEEQHEKEAKKKLAEAAMKDMAKRDHLEKVKKMREWDEEEMRLLDKAVNKFPQGTPKRWEQVASYIRTRPLDEVLLMVKERQGASALRLQKQEDWKAAQKKPSEVTCGADTRNYAFTDVQVNLRGEAAAKMNGSAQVDTEAESTTSAPPPAAVTSPAAPLSKRQAAAAAAAAAKASQVPSKVSQAAAAKAAPAPSLVAIAKEASSPATKAAASPAAKAAAKAPAAAAAAAAAATPAATPAAAGAAGVGDGVKKAVVSSSSGEWNEEQELALVKAMKQFGKEREDRWERVSEVVPGKSKAQCLKRFKELREAFRTKKEAA